MEKRFERNRKRRKSGCFTGCTSTRLHLCTLTLSVSFERFALNLNLSFVLLGFLMLIPSLIKMNLKWAGGGGASVHLVTNDFR